MSLTCEELSGGGQSHYLVFREELEKIKRLWLPGKYYRSETIIRWDLSDYLNPDCCLIKITQTPLLTITLDIPV